MCFRPAAGRGRGNKGHGGGDDGGASAAPTNWRRMAVTLALVVAPVAVGAAAVLTHLGAIHTLENWTTPLHALRAAAAEADDPLVGPGR